MRSAVIVSTARTPIGRAYRGAFNDTQSQTLGGHVIAAAVQRAGVAPAEVDDVVMGAALQQGAQGFNMARQCALAAGLPDSVAGMTVDRQCSSGLMAIATAAKSCSRRCSSPSGSSATSISSLDRSRPGSTPSRPTNVGPSVAKGNCWSAISMTTPWP